MSPESTDAKLASDAAEIAAGSAKTLPKVQLDIDDAPFLREKEPEAPPPPPEDAKADAPPEASSPPAEDKAASKKKKLLIIGAAAFVLLLVGGGGALWWFVIRTPPPPPPTPQVVVVPTPPKETAPAEFLIPIAPFWLELSSTLPRDQDKIFFLVCKFTAITKAESVNQEAQNKIIVIRDALYFYLKNKSYEFLTDPGNTQTIKNDLVSVINNYLSGGKVEDLLFERYLTK
ncbi:MAG: flagellar basal body-associated FliL family protein [Desulfovibrionaceae bacterium]|nr:flagellar basal body-associated FliL family protein [Desulfovibrionaceae bacterium]